MKEITKEDLLKAQQGEINAVILYQKMANRVAKDNQPIREKLLGLASDEGRHASMLKKLTGEVLQPTSTLANMVVCLSYILGIKRTLLIMAKAEHKALETYKPFVAQYPELEPMRLDEGRKDDCYRKEDISGNIKS